jgi:hypothetical protein
MIEEIEQPSGQFELENKIARMIGVYGRMCYSLRVAARVALVESSTIVEVGHRIQSAVQADMSGESDHLAQFFGRSGILGENEAMTLHMDCMNGHGK